MFWEGVNFSCGLLLSLKVGCSPTINDLIVEKWKIKKEKLPHLVNCCWVRPIFLKNVAGRGRNILLAAMASDFLVFTWFNKSSCLCVLILVFSCWWPITKEELNSRTFCSYFFSFEAKRHKLNTFHIFRIVYATLVLKNIPMQRKSIITRLLSLPEEGGVQGHPTRI